MKGSIILCIVLVAVIKIRCQHFSVEIFENMDIAEIKPPSLTKISSTYVQSSTELTETMNVYKKTECTDISTETTKNNQLTSLANNGSVVHTLTTILRLGEINFYMCKIENVFSNWIGTSTELERLNGYFNALKMLLIDQETVLPTLVKILMHGCAQVTPSSQEKEEPLYENFEQTKSQNAEHIPVSENTLHDAFLEIVACNKNI